LPRVVQHRGITVRFAEPGSDADTVIEELVRAHSSPRKLVVVSSDHRLHRAARRRKAKAIDSDQWYAEVLRSRLDRLRRKSSSMKPSGPASEEEVRFWLRQFSLEDPTPPAGTDAPAEPPLDSPFPPGYGEDIREGDV
jgi:hypothetical protein